MCPFQRCISISALYLHFSVLSPFQRFIPISAFYPHFSVLSPFQRFIPISAFYPHFSVLSPFQRFIPISAFYPHFSFRFQFPFPRFSFSVLSLPLFKATANGLWPLNASTVLHVNKERKCTIPLWTADLILLFNCVTCIESFGLKLTGAHHLAWNCPLLYDWFNLTDIILNRSQKYQVQFT